VWRIAAENPTFPGPTAREGVTAEKLIAQLDEAGIERAAVLSVAYWHGSPFMRKAGGDEYANVRAENDWTVREVARFPDRLVAFCSFNPLKDYALEEIDRCAKLPRVKGLKLHFGNSEVDVKNPEHVEKVRRVFAAANKRRLAIVAHLWTMDRTYGREHAEIFLRELLPAAPDIPVQIAHFAGGGPGYTDEALEVFANAITANDPRTKNLYFDIATVADGQSKEVLQKLAERIRQVGLHRILYGTDTGPPPARQSWLTFRTTVPLTDEEFKTIAGNVAPYFR
jgi:predicted TIM-barrel fold metal-dependent hydrolase